MLGSCILLPAGFGVTGIAIEQWGSALVFVGGGLLTAVISPAASGYPASPAAGLTGRGPLSAARR